MTHLAYLGFGSNLGDSKALILRALQCLEQKVFGKILAVSSLYKTLPVGGPADQSDYINGCAAIVCNLEPLQLLEKMRAVEEEFGRVREVLNGPRTIDLDLLLFDDQLVSGELQVPHPRMHTRSFVLRPLFEIAPFAIHPILNRTIAELLFDLEGIIPLQSSFARELEGRKILVTGSTSGIGMACAVELALAGAKVVFHGRKPLDKINAYLDFAANCSGFSRYIQADLKSEDGCSSLIKQAWDDINGLDGVLLNAGADILTGEISQMNVDQKFKELIQVDLHSTFSLAREFGKRMKLAGKGVLLTTGWDQAVTGFKGDSGEMFAAIKGGVMNFSRSLSLSLAPEVRVNCIAPGWIKTSWGETASEYWQQKAKEECPLQRWGEPQDIASAARWLFSDKSSFVSGQILAINGGIV